MNSRVEYVGCTNKKLAKSALEPNSILQDGHTRPQRAGFIRDYLQNLGVERMEWPVCSADLNPTEHLWDQLGRAVLTRVTNATTLADLQQLLVEEWDAIPQQCVTKLATSMRRRCQAVVAYWPSHFLLCALDHFNGMWYKR
uniref:Tc1-like transposase DDE domain-containing protein n=1 Tax=Pundamilia nyererei TaxID=303518 RepID=A0A3B4H5V0_9CICH